MSDVRSALTRRLPNPVVSFFVERKRVLEAAAPSRRKQRSDADADGGSHAWKANARRMEVQRRWEPPTVALILVEQIVGEIVRSEYEIVGALLAGGPLWSRRRRGLTDIHWSAFRGLPAARSGWSATRTSPRREAADRAAPSRSACRGRAPPAPVRAVRGRGRPCDSRAPATAPWGSRC